MISGEDAARIGISQSFKVDCHAEVDIATRRFLRLGIRHLRSPVCTAVYRTPAGRAWYDWLFRHLGEAFTLLPALEATAGADLVSEFIDGHGEFFETLELTRPEASITAVAVAAKRAGKQVVAGGLRTIDLDGVLPLAERGLFAAVGLAGATGEDWQRQAEAGLAVLRRRGEAAALWITEAGFDSPTPDPIREAQAFLAMVDAPAARVYWRGGGRASGDQDGWDGASDEPELLARLLVHGVAHVRRIIALGRPQRACRSTSLRPVLVTGGAGFIGCNLTDRLAAEGHDVIVYDALARPGVERNLQWLARRHPTRISFTISDVRDRAALEAAARQASAVFHLAGQVAVTTSLVHPLTDYAINTTGTLNLLETLRLHNPAAPLIFASTNKVYGSLDDIALSASGQRYLPTDPEILAHGVSETRPLDFHTPYGCSKGAADQYVLDYARSFGLRTVVLRMSCIYGQRQLGTEDQGWVAHFLLRAMASEGITLYGDGMQVRDILHVDDAVAAYLAAWRGIGQVTGRAYNLGGGPANAVGLRQVIDHMGALLGHPVDVGMADWRQGDQRYFVADTRAVRRDLGWAPQTGWRAGVASLARTLAAEFPPAAPWQAPANTSAKAAAG